MLSLTTTVTNDLILSRSPKAPGYFKRLTVCIMLLGLAVIANPVNSGGLPTTPCDFNGDTFHDLPVGVAHESVGSVQGAGAVNVIYGDSNGLSASANQLWDQGTSGISFSPEFAAYFGAALACGDFNADGYDDLAVGAPYQNAQGLGSSPVVNAGAVNIIYGSPSGLSSVDNQGWQQGSVILQKVASIKGFAQHQDLFGFALTTGDFNGDFYDDLAVGVPGESVDGQHNSGAVNIVFGGPDGLTAENNQFLHQNQNTNLTLIAAEVGDRFGESLTSDDFNGDGYTDLAIGVPGKFYDGPDNVTLTSSNPRDALDADNAGVVSVIYGSANGINMPTHRQLRRSGYDYVHGELENESPTYGVSKPGTPVDGDVVNANSFSNITGVIRLAGYPFANTLFGYAIAAGDFNGDNLGDLAIGVPKSGGFNGGSFHVVYGTPLGLSGAKQQIDSQYNDLIPGAFENNDFLGASIAAADINNDGFDELVVGVPGEDLKSIGDAGMLHVFFGSSDGLIDDGNQVFHQNTRGIKGVAEPGDKFGSSLTLADFDADGYADITVGIPGESIDANDTTDKAGAVAVIYGNVTGASTRDDLWHQDSDGIQGSVESYDQFSNDISLFDGL